MERKKANNISVVLGGLAVILMVLPLFGVYNDRMEAVALGVFILAMSAVLVRQLVDR